MMTLADALDVLGISPWPRTNKLPCPAGHQTDDGRSTPALHLYEDTNSFYCFSCGATGDAYGLIALTTGTPIEEVLKQYGDGEGKPRHQVSTRRMYEAVVAAYQDWQADYWPRLFRAAEQAGVPRDEAAERATWLADQIWDGPLTIRNIPEGRTPSQLEQEVKDVQDTMEQAIVWLREQEQTSDVPRTAVQPEVPHPGGHSGGSLREGGAAGGGDQVRVGSSERDDASHVDSDQAPTRLLHGGRLSRRGSRLRSR